MEYSVMHIVLNTRHFIVLDKLVALWKCDLMNNLSIPQKGLGQGKINLKKNWANLLKPTNRHQFFHVHPNYQGKVCLCWSQASILYEIKTDVSQFMLSKLRCNWQLMCGEWGKCGPSPSINLKELLAESFIEIFMKKVVDFFFIFERSSVENFESVSIYTNKFYGIQGSMWGWYQGNTCQSIRWGRSKTLFLEICWCESNKI